MRIFLIKLHLILFVELIILVSLSKFPAGKSLVYRKKKLKIMVSLPVVHQQRAVQLVG